MLFSKLLKALSVTKKEDRMKKVRYTKPKVVSGSSVHPC
jgi:hypothetical protein